MQVCVRLFHHTDAVSEQTGCQAARFPTGPWADFSYILFDCILLLGENVVVLKTK